MTAIIAWGEATLVASAVLMLVVLAVRAPARRWAGPGLGYALWALPAIRLILPPLPVHVFDGLPVARAATAMSVLFTGPRAGASVAADPLLWSLAAPLAAVWLAGAVGLFAVYAVRHVVFCRRLRTDGAEIGRVAGIRVIATSVDGPLAFGVVRRFIAVPRDFLTGYRPDERALVLAHERAHHARGDLLANWASLVVLAAHWWNPVAWFAIRAFRDDQEFAADARVLAGTVPGTPGSYARVLVKAAGIGALPACNLNARSNLKGRLMMIGQHPRTRGQRLLGGSLLALLGGTALVATIATAGPAGAAPGQQAVTIGVKPDGMGGYALIVGATAVPSGAPLPGGRTLPADFSPAGGCDLKPAAKPMAMIIKGSGAIQTYTVMCASAAPAPVRATLGEGLASLTTMRASIATQAATAVFPESERTYALGAVDRSIREVKATLATPD